MTEPLAFDTYNQTLDSLSPTLRDPNGTFGDALPAVLIPPPSACSAASAVSTRDCDGPGFDISRSVSRMLGGARFLPHGSPESRSTRTSPSSPVMKEEGREPIPTGSGQRLSSVVTIRLDNTNSWGDPIQENAQVIEALRGGANKIELAVLISSAAASPAKTCPSPDNAEDSPVTDPVSSTSLPGSPGLFDPDGYSSRTYPDSSPRTAVGTSESCLERWPTSGTAWHGGFSTHVSSECRSAAGVCSSSEPSLSTILEPPLSVPDRYSLSGRAARGILRRAEKRGRILPGHLAAALESVAGLRTPSA